MGPLLSLLKEGKGDGSFSWCPPFLFHLFPLLGGREGRRKER